MTVDFFFCPPTVKLPALATLRSRWTHLPEEIAHAVALEEQYLLFHLKMLDRVHFTAAGQLNDKPWVYPLGLSVRAGAIKAAILIAASIAEAALRAIAEERSYRLPSNPRGRTMGKVLNAWKEGGSPRPEVAAVWNDLGSLHRIRNNIHLIQAVEDEGTDFEALLKEEADLVPKIMPLLDHLSAIRP